MPRIVLLSDTHGRHHHWTNKVPDGDIVIHAGDISKIGTEYQVVLFLEWFSRLPHKHKIFTAGNHDHYFQKETSKVPVMLDIYPQVIYLYEESVTVEGLKIYGSPWTPWFYDWAFNYVEEQAASHWDRIPNDTNVLITHGPPHKILDRTFTENAGCKELAKRVLTLPDLKVHVFGHIHEGKGVIKGSKGPIYVNASMVDGNYNPLEEITVIDL